MLNSWAPSRRKASLPHTLHEDGLYSPHRHERTSYAAARPSALAALSRSLYLRYLLFLLLGLVLGRTTLGPTRVSFHPTVPTNPPPHAPAREYANATLGTAAILALNSPSRPDRRDFLTLMAAMSDMSVTFVDTWTTKPVEKALPNEHNPGLKDVEYACWRSHADAWRRVVEEGWTTAMVIEDDADWDGGIHESMALAWDALVKFTNDPHAATEAKSYPTRSLMES